MGVRLQLDPDSIAAAGGVLAGIAQRMADDVAVLESTVHGAATPWGDDESGSAFAVAYQSVLGHALGALGSYVQQMGDAALNLAVQARALADTDAESASALSAAGLASGLSASGLASGLSASGLVSGP